MSHFQTLRRVAIGCLFALVASGCGVLDDAASAATTSLNTTTSFVRSRSSQAFLVRYVSADTSAATSVFALPAGQAGGGLGSLERWAGRLEVLRDDCSVVGTVELEASSHSFVVVTERGVPERVPSSDAIDAPTNAQLDKVVGRCGAP